MIPVGISFPIARARETSAPVAMTQAAFKITQAIAMIRIQGKMDYSAQSAVWDRLLDLPMTFFRDYSAGDLADRASGVDQIRAIVAGAGVAAILGSFSSIFNVFQMIGYSFKLAAVAIGLTLFYVSVTTGANYFQLRYQREEQKRRGRIMGLVLQLISGVAKLRVSGAENHAFRVWATAFAEQRKVSFSAGRVRNVMAVFNSVFPVFSWLIPALPGAHHSCVTCGDCASFQISACSRPPEPMTRSFIEPDSIRKSAKEEKNNSSVTPRMHRSQDILNL